MSEPDGDIEVETKPVVIDISAKDEIRKERKVALVLFLLICGLTYIIYKNLH